MIVVQIAGLGQNSRTILGRLGHLRRKTPFHLLVTVGAFLDLSLVFRRVPSGRDSGRGQVKDLASLMFYHRHLLQVRFTVWAERSLMHHLVLRLRHHPQRASFVAGLSAQRPLPFRTQTLGRWFLQPVAAGRLATVVALLGQLISQFLYQFLLFRRLLLQRCDQSLLLYRLILQQQFPVPEVESNILRRDFAQNRSSTSGEVNKSSGNC